MTAISGRLRFGGFSAASIASVSPGEMRGGAAATGAEGRDNIQPMPNKAASAATTRNPRDNTCLIISLLRRGPARASHPNIELPPGDCDGYIGLRERCDCFANGAGLEQDQIRHGGFERARA